MSKDITHKIFDDTELAVNILRIDNEEVPKATGSLTSRSRWLQLTIKNETQFFLKVDPETAYLDSGEYVTKPALVHPFHQMTFSGANIAFAQGITGGQVFKLQLGEIEYIFAIGFTNPLQGTIKAGVAESNSSQDGYNAAVDYGTAITSSIYHGKDEAGNKVHVKFRVSACPGQEGLYVLRQIKL